MTTYNTGNPLGSAAAKDLFDNAQNLDFAVNSITQVLWADRFGKNRKTFWGMEQEFAAQLLSQEQRFNLFIQNSGYQVIGDYAEGPLTITEYNQLIRYEGELWKITAATDVPFTTTGVNATSWANDSTHFVSVGDAALRQELVSNRILSTSPSFYGAIGDGLTDDTSAFEQMEALVKGIDIDLRGMSFVVSAPFNGNNYKNGYFIIDGVTHPSSFSVSDVRNKKHCATFLTGDPNIPGQSPIFSGAEGTFQGICAVVKDGDVKLYVTNRSSVANASEPSYGNFLKGETYRIVEYSFSESGSDLVATAFSNPLNTIGHASMLSHRFEGEDLYFYSGSPNESTTDTTLGGKGFSRIKWNGSDTSNSDVTNFTMFDQPSVSGGIYKNLSKSNAVLSPDGRKLCMVADDDLQGGYVCLIYTLDDLLVSSTPKNVLPESEFNFPLIRGYTLQGVTLSLNSVVITYQAPYDTVMIMTYDFAGNVTSRIENIDLIMSLYTESQYRSSVAITLEPEGSFLISGDLYLGVREIWNSVGTVVSYGGKYFSPRTTTMGNSPDNSNYWWEVSDNGASTSYSPTTTYTVTGSRTKNSKHIYKISSLIESDSDSIQANSQLHTPPVTVDPSIDYANDSGNFGWRRWVRNLKKWMYTLHVSDTGNFRFYDTSSDSQGIPAMMISLFDKLVGSTRTHYARIRGGETDGGNILLYSSDDSTRPGGIAEYVGPNSSVSRETDQYGQTYFKTNTANNVPLRADVNGTYDAQRWSRNGTVYAGLRLSTVNGIFTTRNGAALILGSSTSVDGVTSDTTARVNINTTDMALRPDTNNNLSLGKAAYLWTTVYASTGAINTSDEDYKQDITSLSDAEIAVGMACAPLICKFRMIADVEAKGDAARYHFGIIAQKVKAAFEDHGLDGFDYGVLCYDEWEDQYEPVMATRVVSEVVTDDDGSTRTVDAEEEYDTGDKQLVLAAGSRYAIRYDELSMLVISALYSKVNTTSVDFEKRLAALESK